MQHREVYLSVSLNVISKRLIECEAGLQLQSSLDHSASLNVKKHIVLSNIDLHHPPPRSRCFNYRKLQMDYLQ
ncbi:hypothetical protein ABVT39_001230 [Epinephelus coioides]